MAPLVSVVMSVYNGARFLRPAVESIITQKFTDLEFIIVDDGSTDETRVILSAYAALDDRMVLVCQENHGQAAALNRGCAMARGKYIARMDADDVALAFRLQHQIDFLKRHPDVGLIGGGIEEIDEAENSLHTFSFPADNAVLQQCLMQWNPFSHPAVVFYKAAFDQTGGYRPAFVHADDYDLWLRIAERYAVANLPEVVLQYRIHRDQITARHLRQQIISVLGSRAAARARRAKRREPFQQQAPVSMADLRGYRVSANEIGKSFSEAFLSVMMRMSEQTVVAIAYDWLADDYLIQCMRRATPVTLARIHGYRAKAAWQDGARSIWSLSLLTVLGLVPRMFASLLVNALGKFTGYRWAVRRALESWF